MKKSVLSLVALVVLSSSTLTASAAITYARGGSMPLPQARGGSMPLPQSTFGIVSTVLLTYFGF